MMRKDNLLLIVIGLLPWSLWSVFYGVKVLPQLETALEFSSHPSNELNSPKSMLRVTREENSGEEQKEMVKAPQSNKTTKWTPPDNKDAPLFVLQVGPSKTGTSSLQMFANDNVERLKEENFYFLGHYRHNPKRPEWNLHKLCESCYSCKYNKDCECKQNWEAFEKEVEDHYQKGHNVLVIEEMFSNFLDAENENQNLWNYLVPLLSKWQVRIVFTYRRYYEWIPSAYFQAFNPAGSGKNTRKIAERQNWPDEGGKVIQTFPDYFNSQLKLPTRQPAGVKQKWDDHFSNVWVFNMNNGGDIIQTFACQMLPEAPKLCNHLKSNGVTVMRNPSSSKNLHFDMLAVEARKRGWVDKKVSRGTARRAIEEHSKKLGFSSVTDFPPHCLSEKQTKTLLDTSLAMEKDMVPKFFESPAGEAELRAGFDRFQETGKFCSIDVRKSLEDKSWQNFFKDLGPEKGKAAETARQ